MMIDKTKLGIEFFDETFGGIYRGRPVFCYGRRDSGKSVIASYFLHQAFLDGDRSLLLTDWQAKDALIVAEAVGVPFTHMVRTGNLTILEYSSFIPGVEMCADSPLPPTAFIELQKIIVTRSIRRVVLDTALPWLAIHPIERMPGHVYSFIHALERLNVTVLLTLPWPASTPAFMLKNRLEDICPVVFIVQKADDSSDSFFKVAKYLGDNLSTTTPIAFKMHGMKSGERVLDSEIPAAAANPAARVPYVATPFEQAGSAPSVPYSPPSSPQLRAVPPSRQQAPQAAPLPPAGDDRSITFSSVIDL